MQTYIIKNEKDLEKYKDDYGYHIEGDAEFEYSAEFTGRLLVDGSLYIKAGGYIEAGEYIKAGGYIEAGEYIKAGGYIEAGWSIEAGTYIEAGWSIKAGGSIEAGESIEAGTYIEAGESIKAGTSIEAGWYIEAGGSIEAGTSIKAGESYGISAGLYITCKTTLAFGLKAYAGICTWREATDEDKTITCGKLEKGSIEYGILKETGLEEEVKGKKVTIKLDDGQTVTGTIVES